MENPEELNRKLNRAGRFANLAAVSVASLEDESKSALLTQLVDVISELSEIQKTLVWQHPELEYHFDPGRPPTAFMQRVQQLADEAEKALVAGSKTAAIAKFQEALSLEPPSLAYEFLEKRRNQLIGSL